MVYRSTGEKRCAEGGHFLGSRALSLPGRKVEPSSRVATRSGKALGTEEERQEGAREVAKPPERRGVRKSGQ